MQQTLHDRNVGKQLPFHIYQQVPGENGDQINSNNVGQGIKITATASSDATWTGQDIKLTSAENDEVIMNLISADGKSNAYVNQGGEIDTFTAAAGGAVHDTTNGYAVLKNGSVETAIEGAVYSGTVTFTFSKLV